MNLELDKRFDYNEMTPSWSDAHRYSPASRSRYRLIIKMITDLDFKECVDVGCAQGFLIDKVSRIRSGRLLGCDISDIVIKENQKRYPRITFFTYDLTRPNQKEKGYDLVICSEVIEHIEDWRCALTNLARMSRRYLLITVPSGRMRYLDKNLLGHVHHFKCEELVEALGYLGFIPITVRHWGFPFHTIYEYIINIMFPKKIYKLFAIGKYSWRKKIFSEAIYRLFYINDLFDCGCQLLLLAERRES